MSEGGAQAPGLKHREPWKKEHVLWGQEDGSLNLCPPLGTSVTLGKSFKFCELSNSNVSIGVKVHTL